MHSCLSFGQQATNIDQVTPQSQAPLKPRDYPVKWGRDGEIPNCNKHDKTIPQGAMGTQKRGFLIQPGLQGGLPRRGDIWALSRKLSWELAGGERNQVSGWGPWRVWLVKRRAPNPHSLTVYYGSGTMRGPQKIDMGGLMNEYTHRTLGDILPNRTLRNHILIIKLKSKQSRISLIKVIQIVLYNLAVIYSN